MVLKVKKEWGTNPNPKCHFLVMAVFIGIVIFQFTELKYIWGVEGAARVFNAILLLAAILFIVVFAWQIKLSSNVWLFYVFPGLLIIIGYMVNISFNVIRDPSLLSFYGNILPSAIYLLIPFLLKKKVLSPPKVWNYYFLVVLTIVILGFADLALSSVGLAPFSLLKTPNGIFLSGWFSLLHMLEDGSAYYRFYACMAEPGTLAMVLLPAIVYSVVHKKYFSLGVFSVAMYLTDSLGGYASLLIIALLLPLKLYNLKRIYSIIVFCLIATVLLAISSSLLIERYENKGASRTVRTENAINVISNLPNMLLNNPIGYEFTKTMSADKSEYYYGTNFSIGKAVYFGGTLAVIGYIAALAMFLFAALSLLLNKQNPTKEQIIACTSILALFPFIFQRASILDSALMILLFGPSVVIFLNSPSTFRQLKMIGFEVPHHHS